MRSFFCSISFPKKKFFFSKKFSSVVRFISVRVRATHRIMSNNHIILLKSSDTKELRAWEFPLEVVQNGLFSVREDENQEVRFSFSKNIQFFHSVAMISHTMTHSDAFPIPFFCSPETLAGFFAFFSFAENVPPRPSNLKFSINLLKNRINLCCIKADDAAVRPYGSHNETGRARFQHDTLRQIYIVNPSWNIIF